MTEAASRERDSRRYAPDVSWSVSQMFWFPESIFVSLLAELGTHHMRHETFAVDRDHVDLGDLGDTLVARRHARGETTVLQLKDGVALIEVGRGSATVEIRRTGPSPGTIASSRRCPAARRGRGSAKTRSRSRSGRLAITGQTRLSGANRRAVLVGDRR